jgi:hypothetical protein
VAFSVKDAGLTNTAPTPVDRALRVLCGVANGWTFPVSSMVVIVSDTDLCSCLIIIACPWFLRWASLMQIEFMRRFATRYEKIAQSKYVCAQLLLQLKRTQGMGSVLKFLRNSPDPFDAM